MRPTAPLARAATLVLCTLAPLAAQAVPGPPGWHEVTQPDGTRLRLRHVGGCQVPHFEDERGFTVVGTHGTEGLRWEYARLDGDALERTGALAGAVDPQRLGLSPHVAPPHRPVPPDAPSVTPWRPPGVYPGAWLPPQRHTRPLVILVEFPGDMPARTPRRTYTPAQFAELLFAEQLDAPAAGLPASYTTSYRQLLTAMSGGAFTLDVAPSDVVGWVTAPQPHAHYVAGASGMGAFPRDSGGLLHDVVAQIDDEVDFSRYDMDGDGEVDHVILVVEGYGDGSVDLFWPHMWSTPEPAIHDGVAIRRYMIVNEQAGARSPGVTVGDIQPIGVFGHEVGHILGLPDLYDVDYTSAGAGAWDLMAAGSYFTEVEPAWMGAWARQQLGWEEPWEPPGGASVVPFPAIGLGGAAVRLWMHPDRTSEYLLLENRSLQVEPGLPGEGLLIWHVQQDRVDARQAFNTVNTGDHRPGVGLLQADGKGDLQRNRNLGDAGDPFPGTAANHNLSAATQPDSRAYDGTDSGIRVTGISAPGGVMSATVEIPSRPGRVLSWDEQVGYAAIAYDHARVRFEAPEPSRVARLRIFAPGAGGSATLWLHADVGGAPGAPVWSDSVPFADRGWLDVEVDPGALPLAAGDALWVDVHLTDGAQLAYDPLGEIDGSSWAGVAFDALHPLQGDVSVRVVLAACVDEDGDGYDTCDDEDCDDANPLVHPGASERCDGLDNDCDGELMPDEVDRDGDGFMACEECDDANVHLNILDEDGDGWSTCDGDCDDLDPLRYPGAPERCNGLDDACTGSVPADELDGDGDGWAACAGDCDDDDPQRSAADADGDGWTTCAGDCDDTRADVYPGAPERCNGLDDDCDGHIGLDEFDLDQDGQPACAGDCDDLDPRVRAGDLDGDGFDACAGDCDDYDRHVHPGAVERCNGRDDDCDGELPEDELDFDGDGLINCADGDDDGDGVVDAEDPAPLDPMICGDRDGDGCDDCSVLGVASTSEDGYDPDGDGMCDPPILDADGDGVPDDEDPDPHYNGICGDRDGDGCDDCALTKGPPDPSLDGPDVDGDGMCEPFEPGCGGGCSSGGPPGLTVGLLAVLAGLRRRRGGLRG